MLVKFFKLGLMSATALTGIAASTLPVSASIIGVDYTSAPERQL